MSSLYDDIGIGESEKAKGWGSNSGFKLLGGSHLKGKNDKKNFKKGGPALAPVLNLKPRAPREEGSVTFNHITGKLEKVVSQRARSPPPPLPTPSAEWSKPKTEPKNDRKGKHHHHQQPQDEGEEYNPLRPNDFEKIVAERRRREQEEREKQREEEKRKELEDRERRRKERHARRDAEEKEREKRRADSSSDEEEDDKKKRRGGGGGGGGAAIAPPAALTKTDPLPGEEKEDGKEKSNSEEPLDPEQMPGSKLFGGSGNVSVVASKIMAKYGFKDGQGLGKGSQGMSTALVVEKTSKRGGKIIHEKDLEYGDESTSTPPPPDAQANAAASSTSITDLMRNPSKVVLLRNMVGPGEVDEDLEPETKEECNEKYGDVISCTIYEVPNAEDDEAVRIFVEFKRVEAAIKAVVDLNGRFFGGRSVKASFYGFDDYKNLSLGLPAA